MIINWFCNTENSIEIFEILVLTLFIENAISKLHAFILENSGKIDAVLAELKLITASQGFAAEFRYWILLCACFNTSKEHNIVKTWKTYEKAFINLV